MNLLIIPSFRTAALIREPSDSVSAIYSILTISLWRRLFHWYSRTSLIKVGKKF